MPATRLLIQSVYDRSMYLMFPVNEYDSWAPKCPLHFSMVLKAGQIQYGLKGLIVKIPKMGTIVYIDNSTITHFQNFLFFCNIPNFIRNKTFRKCYLNTFSVLVIKTTN